MHTRNWSVSLLFGLFVAVVCGSQIAYSAPCDLLTLDQLNTVVGMSFDAGSPIANTGCSWHSKGATSVMITVSFQSEKMFDGAKGSSAPNMTKKAVSGIGDEAIFTGVQGFASLWVRKGTKFLLVRAYGLPVHEAETKLKALAEKAVPKV